jgi:hypothetical protein
MVTAAGAHNSYMDSKLPGGVLSPENDNDIFPRHLNFLEDINADDDEDKDEIVKLSQTPANVNPISKTYYKGPLPDTGVFDENGKVTKRRRWTEEEKGAVKQGVEKYGVGKWKKIKTEYAVILRNRKPVQLKDCWRTMVERKEVSLDSSKNREEDTTDSSSRATRPARKRRANPFPKTYKGPLPDAGVFDEEGKVTKRQRWSDEEKGAVKRGVKKYGVGKWVKIKENYANILRNRTHVQCKDCWRTMVKRYGASLDNIESDSDEE